MIHFIQGKPGGGKSLFSLHQIIEELRTSSRFIVTNLDIKLPELNEYLVKEFGEDKHAHNPGDAWTDRVRILSEEESRRFWLFEGPSKQSERVDINEVHQGRASERTSRPDFGFRSAHGVLFVIDEVHIHFSAREWQKTSTDCIYYCSQHRKLGDDVLLVTQHPEQADKNFRRLAQDFTVLRNMENEQLAGFRIPNRFRRATYLGEKRPNDNQVAQEKGWFKLDKKVASCYHTTAGVGILARTDVKEKKGKGKHPAFALVYIGIFIAVLWFLPGILRGGFTAVTSKVLGSKKEFVTTNTEILGNEENTNTVAQANPADVRQPRRDESLRPPPPSDQVSDESARFTSPLTLKRVEFIGTERAWFLSDGSVYRLPDTRILKGNENYVVIRGLGYVHRE